MSDNQFDVEHDKMVIVFDTDIYNKKDPEELHFYGNCKRANFFRTFFKKFPSASNVSRYKPKMIKSTLPLNPGETPPIPTMIPF